MPYMYILECADGSFYTGSTWDMEKRLWEHQNGQGAHHTARHLPVKLVYVEEGDRIEDAYRREKQVQGWSRKKKLALIAGDSNALHRLAECRNDSHWSGFTSTGSVHRGSAQPTGFGSAQPTGGSAQPTGGSAQPTGFTSTGSVHRDYAQPKGGYAQAVQSAVGSDQSALLMPSDESGRSLSEVEGLR